MEKKSKRKTATTTMNKFCWKMRNAQKDEIITVIYTKSISVSNPIPYFNVGK